MRPFQIRKVFLGLILYTGLLLILASPALASALEQGSSPNPTFTAPAGSSIATVILGDNPEINVRAGPGTDYAIIGKLQAGQSVPALGRSPGGDWVQIAFPQGPGGVGWVYAYLVTVTGMLPVVEPPPTPTPRVTPTVDPTLAAQFIREIPPTRLPTFTPPPSLAIPTFVEESLPPNPGDRPVVYIMIGLGVAGLLGVMLSLVRVRSIESKRCGIRHPHRFDARGLNDSRSHPPMPFRRCPRCGRNFRNHKWTWRWDSRS